MAGLTIGPDSMLKAPITSAYLGAVSNAWAQIEVEAASFMEHLVSEPYHRPPFGILDPIGPAIFGALHTWHQRWAMIRTMLKIRLTPTQYERFRVRFEKLTATLDGAAKIRNTLVHSIWAYTDEHEECLMQSKPYSLLEDSGKAPILIGHDRLRGDILKIQNARHELARFVLEVKNRAKS